jgi:hypothetical protein
MDAIPVTFHLSPDETTYIEVCLAFRRELLALSDTAPDGQVLAHCENTAVEMARQHGHGLLRDAIARRVAVAEKKGRRPAFARVAGCGKAGARTNAPC